MSDLSYVLDKVQSGARVRFALGYFGEQAVIVSRSWLPGRVLVELAPAEIDQVKDALRRRRFISAAADAR